MDTGTRHFWFHLRQGLTFVSFSLFLSFLLLTFSSLSVVFAVLYIALLCVASFLASFGHKLLGPQLWQLAFLRQLYIFFLQLVSSCH